MTIDPQRAGRCYELAFKEFTHPGDPPPPGSVLVHGYPRLTKGPDKGSKFGHAWLETGRNGMTLCFDPVAQILVPSDVYYAVGQIEEIECRRYSPSEARGMALEHDMYGPWEDIPIDALFGNDG